MSLGGIDCSRTNSTRQDTTYGHAICIQPIREREYEGQDRLRNNGATSGIPNTLSSARTTTRNHLLLEDDRCGLPANDLSSRESTQTSTRNGDDWWAPFGSSDPQRPTSEYDLQDKNFRRTIPPINIGCLAHSNWVQAIKEHDDTKFPMTSNVRIRFLEEKTTRRGIAKRSRTMPTHHDGIFAHFKLVLAHFTLGPGH